MTFMDKIHSIGKKISPNLVKSESNSEIQSALDESLALMRKSGVGRLVVYLTDKEQEVGKLPYGTDGRGWFSLGDHNYYHLMFTPRYELDMINSPEGKKNYKAVALVNEPTILDYSRTFLVNPPKQTVLEGQSGVEVAKRFVTSGNEYASPDETLQEYIGSESLLKDINWEYLTMREVLPTSNPQATELFRHAFNGLTKEQILDTIQERISGYRESQRGLFKEHAYDKSGKRTNVLEVLEGLEQRNCSPLEQILSETRENIANARRN